MAVQGGPRDRQTSGATTEELSVDRDDVFDVLSNPRRRYALHTLRREDRELQLGEVAEQVAAWENGTTVESVGAASASTPTPRSSSATSRGWTTWASSSSTAAPGRSRRPTR